MITLLILIGLLIFGVVAVVLGTLALPVVIVFVVLGLIFSIIGFIFKIFFAPPVIVILAIIAAIYFSKHK